MITARQALAGAAATVLLVFLAWITVLPGTPRVYAPFNALVIMPAFWMHSVLHQASKYVAVALIPTFFWIWCLPVVRGCVTAPTRSKILFACTISLSVLLWVWGFQYGIKYQGLTYVRGVTVISVMCWVFLSVLALLASRCPNANYNFTFHVAWFAWLAWYAFPYVGELP